MDNTEGIGGESSFVLSNIAWSHFEHSGDDRDLDEAIHIARRAAAGVSTGTAEEAAALSNLGAALLRRSERTGQAADLDEATAVLRRAAAGVSTGTAEEAIALSNLGAALLRRSERTGQAADLDEATAVLRRAAAGVSTGTAEEAAALSNLGAALLRRSERTGQAADLDEATAVLRRASALSPKDSEEHAAAISSLGDALRYRIEEARSPSSAEQSAQFHKFVSEAVFVYEEVVAARTRLLGTDHPDTLASMNNLAAMLQEEGDLDAARQLHEQVAITAKRVLGEDHSSTLASLNNLAAVLQDQGELDAARSLYEQVLETRRRLLGEDSPSVLASMNNLATVLQDQGELDAARSLYEQVLETRRRLLGEDSPSVLASMNNLATVLQDQGELDAARSLYEQVLETRRRLLGDHHPDTLTSMNNLVAILQRQGEHEAAKTMQEHVLATIAAEQAIEGSVLARLGDASGANSASQHQSVPSPARSRSGIDDEVLARLSAAITQSTSPNANELIQRARIGDAAAWEALIERYTPLVWSVVQSYKLDSDDSQDAAQSTWLKLIAKVESLRDEEHLTSWLVASTRVECLRLSKAVQLRLHEDVQQSPQEEDPTSDVDERIDTELRIQQLREAFRQLPERCQTLLSLLMSDPPPAYPEIAAFMGIPVGSIGPTRARCLASLRARLEGSTLV